MAKHKDPSLSRSDAVVGVNRLDPNRIKSYVHHFKKDLIDIHVGWMYGGDKQLLYKNGSYEIPLDTLRESMASTNNYPMIFINMKDGSQLKFPVGDNYSLKKLTNLALK